MIQKQEKSLPTCRDSVFGTQLREESGFFVFFLGGEGGGFFLNKIRVVQTLNYVKLNMIKLSE